MLLASTNLLMLSRPLYVFSNVKFYMLHLLIPECLVFSIGSQISQMVCA